MKSAGAGGYLATHVTAHLATASRAGAPDVSIVSFALDGDSLVISGTGLVSTTQFRNLLNNPRATLIVDDGGSLQSRPSRGLKVHCHAQIEQGADGAVIRVTPEAVVSWEINLPHDRQRPVPAQAPEKSALSVTGWSSSGWPR